MLPKCKRKHTGCWRFSNGSPQAASPCSGLLCLQHERARGMAVTLRLTRSQGGGVQQKGGWVGAASCKSRPLTCPGGLPYPGGGLPLLQSCVCGYILLWQWPQSDVRPPRFLLSASISMFLSNSFSLWACIHIFSQ